MTIWQKFFSFEGRLRRRDYWLLNIAMGVVIYALLFLVSVGLHENLRIAIKDPKVLTGDYILAAWPALAIMIKRGHDRNIPASISISLHILVQALALWPLWEPHWRFNLEVMIVQVALALVSLIIYGFLDGTRGANRYGPSPKGLGAALEEVFA